ATGKSDGRQQIGSSARHSGPDGPENAAIHGAVAWLRHCPADRTSERERPEPEPGHDLSGTVAPATARMDQGRMGHVRDRTPGKVLFAEPQRTKADRRGNRELGADCSHDGTFSCAVGIGAGKWSGYGCY